MLEIGFIREGTLSVKEKMLSAGIFPASRILKALLVRSWNLWLYIFQALTLSQTSPVFYVSAV